MTVELAEEVAPSFWPEWLEESLHVTPGRDPLGLQTITLDRIMPSLVPGVLALSVRARYLSIYSFLLSHYEERRLAPSHQALSDFIRRWEFEYAVSVMLCPRGCGSRSSAVVGSRRAAPAARVLEASLARDFSVESALGGYGLYYRAPLESLGVVATRGTLLGDTPIPIDVLRPDGRGQQLAEAFGDAIEPTTYFRDFMGGSGPVPREVLLELAGRCCLCRLDDFPDERSLLRDLLLEEHDDVAPDEVLQRRASFTAVLHAIDLAPEVARRDSALYATAIQRYPEASAGGTDLDTAFLQWSALGLKEQLQDGLSCIWAQFVGDGFRLQPNGGFSRAGVRELIRDELAAAGSIELGGEGLQWSPATPTEQVGEFAADRLSALGWEDLRGECIDRQSALAGLILILAVVDVAPELEGAPRAWLDIAMRGTSRQPSLAQFLAEARAHLSDGDPAVADTLEWLVVRRVIAPHEAIAYSKLPEFTFRFRWEAGWLRFYNIGLWRFDLGDPRRSAMVRLSEDLGLWTDESGVAELTPLGEDLVSSARTPG